MEDNERVGEPAESKTVLEKKWRDRRTNATDDSMSIPRGFIDTQYGALLNTSEAIQATLQKEKRIRDNKLSTTQKLVIREVPRQKKADEKRELKKR